MKKLLLYLCLIQGLLFTANAQNPVIRCASKEYREAVENDYPQMIKEKADRNEAIKKYIAAHPVTNNSVSGSPNGGGPQAGITGKHYIIPIVVHVVYDTVSAPQTMLDSAQINDQIAALNNAFRINNSGIQFCLATKGPYGKPIVGVKGQKGVVYFQSTTVSHADFSSAGGSKVMQTARYYPLANYLNIYVVSSISPAGTGAFASMPGNPEFDGIIIRADVFGDASKPTSHNLQPGYDRGISLVHEMGHYLNLDHPFDYGGCLNYTDSINANDKVPDTPPCTDSPAPFTCDHTLKACDGRARLVQDYMEWTDDYCRTLFTPGQLQREEATLNLFRKVLCSDDNLIQTGVPCISSVFSANFDADAHQLCTNDIINYTPLLADTGVTYQWTFPGGTPSSSTAKNPQVKYSNAGKYDATLTITRGAFTSTTAKTDYIYVDNCTPISSDQGNWYFGSHAALSFQTGKAVAIGGSQMFANKACISASDPATGNLLFYTNAVSVWDKNNALITSALNGDAAMDALHQGVAVAPNPDPTKPGQYYIFNVNPDNNNGLTYSVFDKNITSGGTQGGIVPGKLNIAAPGSNIPATQRITVIPHCNGTDYWIIVHALKNTPSDNRILSYLLNSSGLQLPITSIGAAVPVPFVPNQAGDAQGKFIVSPDGTKIVTLEDGQIYDFNKQTGLLSHIASMGISDFDASFSPSGKILYFASGYQVDFSRFSKCDSTPKFTAVPLPYFADFGSVKRGPDGKMYITTVNTDLIGVVNFPDSLNTTANPNACGYNPNGVKLLSGQGTRIWFPNFMDALPGIPNAAFGFTVSNCGQACFYNQSCGTSFHWDFGVTPAATSTLESPIYTYTSPGTYHVTFTVTNSTRNHSITKDVIITRPAKPTISGYSMVCSGQPSAYSSPLQQGVIYTWTVTGGNYVQSSPNNITVAWDNYTGAKSVKVKVTNVVGCSDSTTMNITNSTLAAHAGPDRVLACQTITIGTNPAATGGASSTYTYNWLPTTYIIGSSTNSTANVSPPSYTTYYLIVKDAQGCIARDTMIVNVFANLAFTLTKTDALCNSSNGGKGILHLQMQGGATPYRYQVNSGAMQTTNSNNVDIPEPAGTYNVVVTDANNCQKALTISITESSKITVTKSTPNSTCPNIANGAAQLTVSGSTPTYSYKWNNGATTSTITGLTSAKYNVTITDANGCVAKDSVFNFVISLSETDALCNGSKGALHLQMQGGAAPYQYAVNSGAAQSTNSTSIDIPEPAGTYNIVVTDASNCQRMASTVISQPSGVTPSFTTKNPDCLGPKTGAIYLNGITGGTSPYTVKMGNNIFNKDTITVNGLTAGDYTIVITDSKGCGVLGGNNFHLTTINNAPSINFGPNVTTCIGSQVMIPSNGSGGLAPYSYQWTSVGASQIISGANTATLTVLSKQVVDTFNLTLTDTHGCIARKMANVIADLTAYAGLNQTTCPNTIVTIGGYNIDQDDDYDRTKASEFHNGIETANGGTPPYTYQWVASDNSSFIVSQTNANPRVIPAANSTSATYTVTVTDAKGCTATAQTVVSVVSPAYFDFTSINTATEPFPDVHLLNADLTWDNMDTVNVRGVIVVSAGTTFTISNNTIIRFSPGSYNQDIGYPQSGIVVLDGGGGTLNITGGARLTYNNTCGQMWDGVEVWGTGNTGNGMVNINTQARIENARRGIALYRTQLPYAPPTNSGPPTASRRGRGVVNADGAVFNQNHVDIEFNAENLQHNASRIQNCTFRCDFSLIDHYSYPGGVNQFTYGKGIPQQYVGNYAHIMLSSVYGVGIFGGNTFLYNAQNGYTQGQAIITFPQFLRGMGIVSYNAGYDVVGFYPAANGKILTTKPNVFRGLYKGIDAYSMGGTGTQIRIRQNNFDQNYRAIITNGTLMDEIISNTIDSIHNITFYPPPSTIPDVPGNNGYGIYTYGSMGYTATDNIINSSASTYDGYGFLARNASNGTIAQAYRNTFTGNFYNATQMSANDSALQVGCNNYTGNNGYDWAITSGGLAAQGACTNFSNTSPAGNVFGSCSGRASDAQIHVNAGAKKFSYSAHNSAATIPTCYDNIDVTLQTCNPFTVGLYNKNTSCPDTKAPVYTPLPGPPAPPPPCVWCPILGGGGIDIAGVIRTITSTVGTVEKAILANQTIRTLLDNNNLQGVIQVIQQTGVLQDQKIIVPTYLLQSDCDNARKTLNGISTSGVENQAYHQLFDMLVNVCASGRAVVDLKPQEMAVVVQVASTNTSVAVNAQALLGSINKITYNRLPEIIIPATGASARYGKEEEPQQEIALNALIPAPVGMKIVPNPTAGLTTLIYSVGDATEGTIEVINLLGKVEKRYKLSDGNGQVNLNANELINGIYFVKLTDSVGRLISLQKMIVNY